MGCWQTIYIVVGKLYIYIYTHMNLVYIMPKRIQYPKPARCVIKARLNRTNILTNSVYISAWLLHLPGTFHTFHSIATSESLRPTLDDTRKLKPTEENKHGERWIGAKGWVSSPKEKGERWKARVREEDDKQVQRQKERCVLCLTVDPRRRRKQKALTT